MEAGIITFGHANSHGKNQVKNELGQGPHIVRQCCLEAGISVHNLHERWHRCDVVMVGLYWWEHLYDLVLWLAAHGIEPDREKRRKAGGPLVFIGGQLPSYNPSTVAAIADLVCIGDGESAAPAVLSLIRAGAPPSEWASVPGIYVSELDNCAEWQHVDDVSGTIRWPFYNSTLVEHDSGVHQKLVFERRIEIARGCRHKCAYCGVGWTKRYREVSTAEICGAVASTPGMIKAFAPDPLAHSGWDEIDATFVEYDKSNQARDISAHTILTKGFGRSRIYTTGIDGLSERLRRAVNKRLSQDELVEVLERTSGHGGQLMIYMILDLPGETEADYREWFASLSRVQVRTRPPSGRFASGDERDFYVAMTLTAFNPTPHTPLQWEGIDIHKQCYDWYRQALDVGLVDKSQRRLKHKILGRPHGGAARLLEAAALRGDRELGRFVLRVAAVRHRFKTSSQVLTAADRLGVGEALHNTVRRHSLDETLPWERRVRPLFGRDTLQRAALKFRNIVGQL
ncbi:MAG: radical SAM protein [Pseudomonadota bacterium]